MNNEKNQIRAFIAIPLPKEITFFLQDLQKQLQKSGIQASWPKPANMHLTLKFFGNLNVHKIDAIKACMTSAAKGIPVHSLYASGIGMFPSVKNTRVIWAGLRGQTEILEKLTNCLEERLFMDAGIKKENKRFSPHLTLARIKQPVHPKTMVQLLEEFKNFSSEDFLVSKINFFHSKLTSSQAVHKIIFQAHCTEK